MISGLLLVLACAQETPREAPFPVFDMGGPVVSAAAVSAFEAVSGQSGASELQVPVTLGGVYLSTLKIPAQGGEWTWSEQLGGKATLVSRVTAGSAPDVVIYAERGPEMDFMPSVQIRRFLSYADAGANMLATWSLRYADELSSRAKAVSGLDLGGEQLLPLASAFVGGLGYASTPGSFSGWKWVGRTLGTDGTDRVDVRLGRWEGSWTDGESRIASTIEALQKADTQADWWTAQRSALLQALEGKGIKDAEGKDARAASMIAGSVSMPRGGSTVYVAAVCAEPCAYADTIRDLFESLRSAPPDQRTAAAAATARTDAEEHQKEARVVILDTNALALDMEEAAKASDKLAAEAAAALEAGGASMGGGDATAGAADPAAAPDAPPPTP